MGSEPRVGSSAYALMATPPLTARAVVTVIATLVNLCIIPPTVNEGFPMS